MVWPFKRETRSSSNYSQLIQDAVLSAAEGKASASPLTTAALVGCADFLARAMVQAETTPNVIPSSVLYDCARDLSLNGQYLALFEVGADGPRFIRPFSHTVHGGFREETWLYDLWLSGPSSTTRVQVSRERVVHVRIDSDAATPWLGQSPLSAARQTGRLLAELESSLADEGSTPVGRVVSSPEGPNNVGTLQASINKMHGSLKLVESTSGGYGDRGAAPSGPDWKAHRIGPDFTPAQIQLRADVEKTVCSLFGIASVLMSGSGDGTLAREQFRRVQRATLEPWARLIGEQFGLVLGLDGPVEFDFGRLRASDLAGAGRFFRALAGRDATLDVERALELAGIE